MADGQGADQLAAQAAEAVRRVIADAEARAEQILREAEAEAARIREQAEADSGQIRERAEADARAQIEAARKALDELGGSLAAAVSAATPGAESQGPQAEAEPTITPPAEQPEGAAPGVEAAPGNGDDAAEADDAAVRLVAMKLAVEGMDPAAIEAELIERFGPGDRTELLKEVISRAASA
jgi:hypothetical protein